MGKKIWRRAFVLLALFLTTFSYLPAEAEKETPFPTKKLQAILDSVVAQGIPGASLGVGDRKKAWFGAAGVADVKTKKPMTPDYQMRVASVTKALTALTTWDLIQRKRLSLNSTVNDFLKKGLVLDGDIITIGMLLNHTSGLYDYSQDPIYHAEMLANHYKHWSSVEILGIARKHGMVFYPGTNFAYNNTGYYVLGLILRHVGKTSPNKLFNRLIAKKAYIPKQVEESVFALAENPIFDPEKTAPIANSGLVFSKSNLWLSASANSRFFNLIGYIPVPNESRTGIFF